MGMSFRTDLAQAPLSKQCRRVTRVLEHMREGSVASVQRLKADARARCIAAHSGMARVLSRHQYRARRSTDRRSRIELSKTHAFSSHAIQVGCLNQLLA